MNKQEKIRAIKIEEAKIRASQLKIKKLKEDLEKSNSRIQEALSTDLKKEVREYIRDGLGADDFSDFEDNFEENAYDYCNGIASEIVDGDEDGNLYKEVLDYALQVFKKRTLNGLRLPKNSYYENKKVKQVSRLKEDSYYDSEMREVAETTIESTLDYVAESEALFRAFKYFDLTGEIETKASLSQAFVKALADEELTETYNEFRNAVTDHFDEFSAKTIIYCIRNSFNPEYEELCNKILQLYISRNSNRVYKNIPEDTVIQFDSYKDAYERSKSGFGFEY